MYAKAAANKHWIRQRHSVTEINNRTRCSRCIWIVLCRASVDIKPKGSDGVDIGMFSVSSRSKTTASMEDGSSVGIMKEGRIRQLLDRVEEQLARLVDTRLGVGYIEDDRAVVALRGKHAPQERECFVSLRHRGPLQYASRGVSSLTSRGLGDRGGYTTQSAAVQAVWPQHGLKVQWAHGTPPPMCAPWRADARTRPQGPILSCPRASCTLLEAPL